MCVYIRARACVCVCVCVCVCISRRACQPMIQLFRIRVPMAAAILLLLPALGEPPSDTAKISRLRSQSWLGFSSLFFFYHQTAKLGTRAKESNVELFWSNTRNVHMIIEWRTEKNDGSNSWTLKCFLRRIKPKVVAFPMLSNVSSFTFQDLVCDIINIPHQLGAFAFRPCPIHTNRTLLKLMSFCFRNNDPNHASSEC